MQPETRFKMKVRPLLDAIPGSWWVKIQMVSVRGIPDFLGFINGQGIALELKVDSPLEPLQRHTLAKISKTGTYARVVTPGNLATIMDELNQIANGPKPRRQL